MVRQVHLFIVTSTVALTVFLGSPPPAAAAPSPCTVQQQRSGICHSGHSDGNAVVVTGVSTQPVSGRDEGPGAAPSGKPLTDAQVQALWDDLCYGNGHCTDRGPNTLNSWLGPIPPAPAQPAQPARVVTIADVARFLPTTGVLHAEPQGWAVVAVPANFWVDVAPVTVDGTLLDEPAEVRFTPRLYRWNFGDGGSRTTDQPGASWAALGQEELTETPTSHRYTQRGDRSALVSVVYSAEYRVGAGPWLGVVGAVTGQTPPARVLVVTEHTVLTATGAAAP